MKTTDIINSVEKAISGIGDLQALLDAAEAFAQMETSASTLEARLADLTTRKEQADKDAEAAEARYQQILDNITKAREENKADNEKRSKDSKDAFKKQKAEQENELAELGKKYDQLEEDYQIRKANIAASIKEKTEELNQLQSQIKAIRNGV